MQGAPLCSGAALTTACGWPAGPQRGHVDASRHPIPAYLVRGEAGPQVREAAALKRRPAGVWPRRPALIG